VELDESAAATDRALLSTAEWRGGTPEPDHRGDGKEHEEDIEDARSFLGGGRDNGCLHPQQGIDEIQRFKDEMKNSFCMSDLGMLSYYLGIEVHQDGSGITLDQSAYAKSILEKAGLASCKAVQAPMEEKLKMSKASTAKLVDATMYRSVVGSLRYLVHSRPDIAYAVGYVSRFMEKPTEEHWAAVKHLLRYVAGTLDYGCYYKRESGERGLVGFSDSDMAGNVDKGRASQELSSSSATALSAGSRRNRRWWRYRLARLNTSQPPLQRAKVFGSRGCSVTQLADILTKALGRVRLQLLR
jgi:hypothetical protein